MNKVHQNRRFITRRNFHRVRPADKSKATHHNFSFEMKISVSHFNEGTQINLRNFAFDFASENLIFLCCGCFGSRRGGSAVVVVATRKRQKTEGKKSTREFSNNLQWPLPNSTLFGTNAATHISKKAFADSPGRRTHNKTREAKLKTHLRST